MVEPTAQYPATEPVVEYKLLREAGSTQLSSAVQKALQEGWELHGGPYGFQCGTSPLYIQALVRRGASSNYTRSAKLVGVRMLQVAAMDHGFPITLDKFLKLVLSVEGEIESTPLQTSSR